MSGTSSQVVGSHDVARAVQDNPALITMARVGWVAKGVVYGILGFLALVIAVNGGASSDEASPSGALAKIAESTAGSALLLVLAAGLALYATWRLISALLPGDNDATGWLTRVGYLASAAVYGFLAWSAVSLSQSRAAVANAEQGDDTKVAKLTADLMGHTGGRWLVGLIGIVTIALAGAFVYQGVTRKFEDDMEPAGVGPITYPTIVRLGVAGWVARGLTMLLIGVFLVRAAIDYDPNQARALDDALRRTAGSSWGAALVAVTGVGLMLYAAFAIISAPRQRLHGPRS